MGAVDVQRATPGAVRAALQIDHLILVVPGNVDRPAAVRRQARRAHDLRVLGEAKRGGPGAIPAAPGIVHLVRGPHGVNHAPIVGDQSWLARGAADPLGEALRMGPGPVVLAPGIEHLRAFREPFCPRRVSRSPPVHHKVGIV